MNLKVLYCSNNKLRDWAEVDRLKCLPALEDLLLAGNPICTEYRGASADYRIEVAETFSEPQDIARLVVCCNLRL